MSNSMKTAFGREKRVVNFKNRHEIQELDFNENKNEASLRTQSKPFFE